ncbi:aldehyde dehydrogenase family protein [Streptomyces sp. CA-179760]|uniref:aldehyde dehydrogenase family protein n=1 Tax=Streptomyces sp. CA-179760 TaxID=3240054 RepID=UPI003D8AD5BE
MCAARIEVVQELLRDLLPGMVQRAVEAGATFVRGGRRIDSGFVYEPTILTSVDPGTEIAQEEVFGPVLAVIPFDDEGDAVRIANNSRYGLSGSVHTADEEPALRVARRIRTGTFLVNGGSYYTPDGPFGGYKQSGVDWESGRAGLGEFLEGKSLAQVVVSPDGQL